MRGPPRPARCPRAGRRRPSRRDARCREPALRDQRVPDRVEREDPVGKPASGGGVDDLRAGIDEVRRGGRAAPAEPPVGRRKKSPGPAWPMAAARGTRAEQRPHRPVQAAASGRSGFGPRPDHVGVEREDRARPEERQRLPSARRRSRAASARARPATSGATRARCARSWSAWAWALTTTRGMPASRTSASAWSISGRPGDLDQRLRPVAGQRAHARAEAGGEDHQPRSRRSCAGLDAREDLRGRAPGHAARRRRRAARATDARDRRSGAPRPAAGRRGSAACRRGGRGG